MRFGGIDEAGYGPLIGPLSIIGVAADAEDAAALKQGFARAKTGAKDSKQVHTPGDIAGIESVALPAIAWLTGAVPTNALALFDLLGETMTERAGVPWLMEAAGVSLPVAGGAVRSWNVPGVTPRLLRGALVQPREYNARIRGGLNKADLELAAVGTLLKAIRDPAQGGAIVVDRLGGRRYYREFLQGLWSDAMVMVDRELPLASAYRVVGDRAEQVVSFEVDGESQSRLTAVASCIAKYARELHMLLLNRWWCARQPGLKPTAGYARDARRWLADVGDAAVDPHRDGLVRVPTPTDGADDDDGGPEQATDDPAVINTPSQ